MNEGSFIPVRYLTSAERYRSPLEPQANGQDVKRPVGPLHLSCPPFPQAQAVCTPFRRRSLGGLITLFCVPSAVAYLVSTLGGPNLNFLVFRADFSPARNPRMGSEDF
jgi:hypothetical protein